MNFQKHRESLCLLSKIIQLFSLTQHLNREQWEIVREDLLSVIVRDISLLFDSKPLVQICSPDRQEIFASSRTQSTSPSPSSHSSHSSQTSIFDISDEQVLCIDAPVTSFSEEEKMLLSNVLDHLKTAFGWRESLEQGFEVQKRINMLHEITVSIRGSLDLSEVLSKTAKDIGESLKISRCFIRRYDPLNPGRVLATEHEYVAPGMVKAADIIFDFETEWMKNLSLDQSRQQFPEFLYIENVNELDDPDGLISALAEEIGLSTFLAVPLLYKESVLGCLCFHQCGKVRTFSKSELTFIRQVADEATGAIIHAEMYQHIQREARTDSLTGLYNKSHFHENLDKEIERCKRSNGEISLMMIDLDFLKRANDTFGHIAGDEMIKLLGSVLRKTLRQVDIIARFGGDEFGAILPDTSLEGAKQLGKRLIEQILSAKHPVIGNMSASVGIAGTPMEDLEKEKLIEMADQALYLAKRKGKGRVCFSDDPDLNEPANEAQKEAVADVVETKSVRKPTPQQSSAVAPLSPSKQAAEILAQNHGRN